MSWQLEVLRAHRTLDPKEPLYEESDDSDLETSEPQVRAPVSKNYNAHKCWYVDAQTKSNANSDTRQLAI